MLQYRECNLHINERTVVTVLNNNTDLPQLYIYAHSLIIFPCRLPFLPLPSKAIPVSKTYFLFLLPQRTPQTQTVVSTATNTSSATTPTEIHSKLNFTRSSAGVTSVAPPPCSECKQSKSDVKPLYVTVYYTCTDLTEIVHPTAGNM